MTHRTIILLGMLLSACATTIKGRVVSSDEKTPIRSGKVNVQHLNSSTGTRAAFVTDIEADGSFETSGDLPAGEYLVEPLIPGFSSESKTIKAGEGPDLLFKANPILTPKRSSIGASSKALPIRGEGAAVLTPPEM